MGFGKSFKKAVSKVSSTVSKVTDPVVELEKKVTDPLTSTADEGFSKAGSDIKHGAKKGYREYDRYTSSKTGAYITPYLSMYDSDGRDALMEAWGGYAAAGAGAYNPAAGAAVGTAVNAYNQYNELGPYAASPGGGGAFATPTYNQPMTQPEPVLPGNAGDNKMIWIIVGGVAAVIVVGAVLYLAVRKR